MTAMADSFMLNNEVEIHLNFASSGTLARQLKNGAPAHLYVSASKDWMNYCIENTLVDTASISSFLHNSLVWVAPLTSGLDTSFSLEKINATQKIAIGDPAHVPAGNYAREYLKKIGLWNTLQASFIPCRNVKNTLFMVERAEVEYALVYYSDAVRSNKVKIVEMIPDSLHSTIELSMALTGENAKAAEFFAYLMLDSNKPFYQKIGFKTLD